MTYIQKEGLHISIEIIDDSKSWDEFIDSSPGGMLAHKWNYLKIMQKYSGFRLFNYGIYNRDSLIGVLPIFRKNLFGMNISFSPPPKMVTPYLGFVMCCEHFDLKQSKKEKYLVQMADEMERECYINPSIYTHFDLTPEFVDIRPFKWNNYSVEVCHTFKIDLRDPMDVIYGNFTKGLKSKLRMAEKKNYELIKSNNISDLYNMLKIRYNEQNLSLPIVSKDFLDDLMKAYPDNIHVYYILDENGRAVTGTATQEYKIRFLDWIGGAKSINGVNEHMEWLLLQQAKLKDYKVFDFVGANSRNISTYKAKFNPSIEVNFSISKKNLTGKASEWVYHNFKKKCYKKTKDGRYLLSKSQEFNNQCLCSIPRIRISRVPPVSDFKVVNRFNKSLTDLPS
ncbi:MAG: hypothetical protein HPY61_05985 [Methanotrichaceae archaeon]|nr:hypothetical protein [Methanotrichaceae archaeon]